MRGDELEYTGEKSRRSGGAPDFGCFDAADCEETRQQLLICGDEGKRLNRDRLGRRACGFGILPFVSQVWPFLPVRTGDSAPEPVLQGRPRSGFPGRQEIGLGVCLSSINAAYSSAWIRVKLCGGFNKAGGAAMAKKVMIVEDNELNMKLFRDLIEASGYETVRTRNGLEALDLARLHRPDLILMDIQLPEVSGLEVTKWLKEDDDLHTIPVIAVTAFAMKGDEERIRQGGCEAYISKPISVPRFIETIKSYLGDA